MGFYRGIFANIAAYLPQGLALGVLNNYTLPKLEELKDPVHPKKSMLLTAVVYGLNSSLTVIFSHPLNVAVTRLLHSTKSEAEYQGDWSEMRQ